MTPELSRRLAYALDDVGDATLDQRNTVVDAAQQVDTFELLPPDVQALVAELEGNGRPVLMVEAVRDDGALLVTSGPAAVVVSDDGDWVTGRDSALSRGNWTASTGDPFPDLDTATLDRLAEYRTELEAA